MFVFRVPVRIYVPVALFLTIVAAIAGQGWRPGTAEAQGKYTVQNNVTYCTVGSTALLADVYTPFPPTTLMPLVIQIHGGGWSTGDKASILGPPKTQTLNALTSHGYVVAAINYRLTPTYPFPAQIEDVKCAVRSFRAAAALYNIDPTRVGAWGDSAGGHLASILGTTSVAQGWDVGQYLTYSSRVEGVADWFGPDDLRTLPQTPGVLDAYASTFPLRYDLSTLQLYSPTTYVTADDSPTIIHHGLNDMEVPYGESQEMFNSLTSSGVVAQLIPVRNAGHEFVPWPPGAIVSPTYLQIGAEVARFFDKEIKNNPNPLPQ